MAYDFKAKKILVTGAGRNIGRTIATSLAKQGAEVYALDCIKTNLNDLMKQNADIIPVHQDLQNWDETVKTVEQLGYMDGLVNCAGVLYLPQKGVDVPKEDIEKNIAVNLNAPINLMQVVGKKMMQSKNGGSIVNISSIAAINATSGFLSYAVSKAGLDMATKMFALELGPHNICVNSLRPGVVMTDMSKTLVKSDEDKKQMKSKIPLGRSIEMQAIADLVLFLLSDQSSMISGANYVIDGGFTCQLP